MTCTIKDVAKEVGVTPSIVSRVLNGKARQNRIKQATVDLVLKKAQELNYQPNQIARGLRLKSIKTIGCIAPDIANPFFSGLIKEIQNLLSVNGYNLMIFDSNDDTRQEKKIIDMMRSKGLDGLIIIPVGKEGKHLQQMADDGFPLVLLYRVFEGLDLNSVTVDNYSAIVGVMDKLLEEGHTKIAMIQGNPDIFSSRERLRAYKDCINKAGLKINEAYLTGKDYTYSSGYEGTGYLLSLSHPPTAIIATSDMICLGALQALAESGKKTEIIPFESLHIIGSILSAECSVTVPKKRLAKEAVHLLLDSITKESKSERNKIILPCKINNKMQPI
jgi:LacI family transcriptional regulator